VRVVALRMTARTLLILVGVACAGGPPQEGVVRLYVDDGGRGRVPVVLLHSLAGRSGQFAALLEYLRRSRRAVALDLRGHGRSPAPADGDYAIPAMARDVAAAVDDLALQRFVLVGHSMGGLVAVAYADQHPERVAALLLLDPAGDARLVPTDVMSPFLAALDSDYTATIEEYWESILAGSRPTVRDSVMADLRATPRATVTGIFRALLEFDPGDALRRYDRPMLSIITHLNEGPTTLHALLPALPTIRVTGTGHWLQMDKPAEINAAIDEFLGTVVR
jgi:pimeloyl-ACP methyl ester carboxylesterase